MLASTTADVGATREELRAADAQIEVSLNRVTSSRARSRPRESGSSWPSSASARPTKLADAGAGDGSRPNAGRPISSSSGRTWARCCRSSSAAEQEVTASRARAAGLREKLGARSGDEQADVAQVRAQLRGRAVEAQRDGRYAPTDGWVINLQLRPGSTVSQLPLNPVMSFVEQGHVILALFGQNELHQVEPGNEADRAGDVPGTHHQGARRFDHLGAGPGPTAVTGTLPQTGPAPLPEGRFAVKLGWPNPTRTCSSPRARGTGAIYTNHLHMIHIIRKVILRVSAYLDWIIIKHHISLH